MAWANSKIFRAFLADILADTTAINLSTDVPKIALYGTTPTPDQNVTSANTAYGVDQWIAGSEIAQAGQWAVGGIALAGTSLNSATASTCFYTGSNTASGAAATLSAVFGCLVYDNTLTTPVAKQGMCYGYFGGTQSVTSGTFTVIWSANGIFRFTL